MKLLLLFLAMLATVFGAVGQEKMLFLQSDVKYKLHYIQVYPQFAFVYEMGSYLDKAGSGPSFIWSDSLNIDPGGGYSGKHSKLVLINDHLFLDTKVRISRRFFLVPVKDQVRANRDLNNAYYLGEYFKMTDEFNHSHPLQHHSFRSAFNFWETNKSKELSHDDFRTIANAEIKIIRDSLETEHRHFELITDEIVKNIKSAGYDYIKERFEKLPAQYAGESRYLEIAVIETGFNHPEFIYRLAQDLPGKKVVMFYIISSNKKLKQLLKSVDGYEELKKESLK